MTQGIEASIEATEGEVEIAPGIFLTKRASDSARKDSVLASAEHQYLAAATPAVQLDYLLRQQAHYILSNNKLMESNEMLKEFDDEDLLDACHENVMVMQRQLMRIDELQEKIDALENAMGKCAAEGVRHSLPELEAQLIAELMERKMHVSEKTNMVPETTEKQIPSSPLISVAQEGENAAPVEGVYL